MSDLPMRFELPEAEFDGSRLPMGFMPDAEHQFQQRMKALREFAFQPPKTLADYLTTTHH
jgi:hypothetical protein